MVLAQGLQVIVELRNTILVGHSCQLRDSLRKLKNKHKHLGAKR